MQVRWGRHLCWTARVLVCFDILLTLFDIDLQGSLALHYTVLLNKQSLSNKNTACSAVQSCLQGVPQGGALLAKAQLTRTACERLFCSLSDSCNGVSCRRSWLQVVVDFTLEWMATCSRLGCKNNGWEWSVKKHCRGRLAAAEHTQLLCHVLATAILRVSWHRQLDSVFCRWYRRQSTVDWCRILFAVCVSCLLQLCIKPMRYIYHPQSNCYFTVTLPLCCRPCEPT